MEKVDEVIGLMCDSIKKDFEEKKEDGLTVDMIKALADLLLAKAHAI